LGVGVGGRQMEDVDGHTRTHTHTHTHTHTDAVVSGGRVNSLAAAAAANLINSSRLIRLSAI
jgi:hypothetical protein